MSKKSKFWKYFREYQWSNIMAMIRNNRKDPLICEDRIDGKLVLITGSTSGIGRLTALRFASMGADLLCINRNKDKSESLREDIMGKYKVKYDYILADLSILEDIHRVGKELESLNREIDIIIHNAGIYLTKRESSVDGLEKVFVVHYLSSFIINYRLIDKLKEQKHARIILVSSEGHRFEAWGLKLNDLLWEKRRYSGLKSYGSAKLAQLLTMRIFKEQFEGSGVTINAMHPGAVKTETGQENGPVYKWFKKNFLDRSLRPAEISANAIYYLAAAGELKNESGKFYNLTTEEEPSPPALDMEVARQLWDISLDLGRLER